jgi:hypothetical protein
MKYAGLMKPPAMMTQEVYNIVISQVASNFIYYLERELDELQDQDNNQEIQPLMDAIDELRESVKTDGTRDIFRNYDHFVNMSFRYTHEGSELKQKSFTGVKDPGRRQEVIELVESKIQNTLNDVERLYRRDDQQARYYQERINEFESLIRTRLKPMKNGDKKTFNIPMIIGDWYVGQEEIENQKERAKAFSLKMYYESLNFAKKEVERAISEGLDQDYIEEAKDDVKFWETHLEKQMKKLNEEVDTIDSSLGSMTLVLASDVVVSHWKPRMKEMVIKIPTIDFDRNQVVNIRVLVDKLHQVIVHEMTHVGQTILELVKSDINEILGKNKNFGMPSRKIRTPEYSTKNTLIHPRDRQEREKKRRDHHLTDVEFFTDLRDATRQIMGEIKRLENNGLIESKQDKIDAFMLMTSAKEKDRGSKLSYVKADPFFYDLKNEARGKWEKAVGEAYKLVFNTALRMGAQRVVSMYLQRKQLSV